MYHPFINDQPGRENDLLKLVEGLESLGYDFVSTFDELVVEDN